MDWDCAILRLNEKLEQLDQLLPGVLLHQPYVLRGYKAPQLQHIER